MSSILQPAKHVNFSCVIMPESKVIHSIICIKLTVRRCTHWFPGTHHWSRFNKLPASKTNVWYKHEQQNALLSSSMYLARNLFYSNQLLSIEIVNWQIQVATKLEKKIFSWGGRKFNRSAFGDPIAVLEKTCKKNQRFCFYFFADCFFYNNWIFNFLHY